MKTFFNYTLGIVLLFFTATCQEANNGLQITGTLQEQGITTYQYGSHTLTTSESFYALTSDEIDLEEYIGQQVTLVVERIEGYPVDGGPEYYRVLEVK